MDKVLAAVGSIVVYLIVGGWLLLTVAGAILSFGKDPMRTRGHNLGPEWECDATEGGAEICVKDVKPLPQSKPEHP